MKLQTVDDLVDDLAVGAKCQADEIEIVARNRLDGGAIGRVVRRLEHVLGIHGGLYVARDGPVQRAGQCGSVGAVDQDRLPDQRVIRRARPVRVRLRRYSPETPPQCRLPGRPPHSASAMSPLAADRDGNLGVELPGALEPARSFGGSMRCRADLAQHLGDRVLTELRDDAWACNASGGTGTQLVILFEDQRDPGTAGPDRMIPCGIPAAVSQPQCNHDRLLGRGRAKAVVIRRPFASTSTGKLRVRIFHLTTAFPKRSAQRGTRRPRVIAREK